MRILVDDQIFTGQLRGGVSRYFVELMRFLSSQSPDVDLVQPWHWTRNVHALEAGIASALPTALGHRRIVRAANRVHAPHRRAHVVHHTYYERRYLRLQPRTLRVVTVYDMIPEVYPELFPRGNPHAGKREFVDAADLVLCISSSTRDDLVRLYGPPSAPVVVTPLGASPAFRPGVAALPQLPRPYVLFVGSRTAYKDFTVLLDAFASLPVRRSAVHLVAVGGGPFGEGEEEGLVRRGIRDRVRQVAVSDSDLPAVYANAACLAFPSRYEGFGLPTVEAMASGCPVVLADSSSHPEVGGRAAMYFPPGDAAALATAISELLTDPGSRAARSAAGLERARSFTWPKTGAATLRAYRQHEGH